MSESSPSPAALPGSTTEVDGDTFRAAMRELAGGVTFVTSVEARTSPASPRPLPDDWLNFAKLVVPELQRRGLTRKEYAGGTLRDRLGLPRPANRFNSK